ncbi:EAL domain-containing protein [Paenibacillus alginolyticus]|uniref:putative bifunctional diguanylate cyclase/phosphodiesterase n=1 Tax=Paenibacillus alginolyticus TaxID=59839 RepID=UPI0006840083|nr:EAL domain-containing protein [Paenibacillus alginolyticus]MCY9667526.1 EAL domain-containing protein [Paenibacillus alginolyticus]
MSKLLSSFHQSREKSTCIRISAIYIFLSTTWVIGSDILLRLALHHEVSAAETFKGLLYTMITGWILYVILKRNMLELWFSKEKTRASEHRFRELFHHANDGIALIELQNDGVISKILEVNETFCRQIGCSRKEILAISQIELPKWKEVSQLVDQFVKQGSMTFEWEFSSEIGQKIPVEISGRWFEYEGNKVILCISRDITERKQTEERMTYLAYHDPITSLPNFTFFQETCSEALQEANIHGHRVCILDIEIDRWKMIHETIGRKFNQLLLQCIAIKLRECRRGNDVLSRGEVCDFKLLLPNISGVDEAIEVARSIIEQFEQPLMVQDNEYYITPRIGIALYPNDGQDLESLFRSAHLALSRGKEAGSRYQLYDSTMYDDTSNAVMLENDLYRAMAGNQFELAYQAQTDMRSGKLMGMEALIRWWHPEKGIISPDQFISLAEETGLIVPIGEWIIYEACRQNKAWQDAGFRKVPIAVNLSICQFSQFNIVGSVQRILEKTGLLPQYLELEITESMTMDVNHTVLVLKDLKALGVQISMDDFGTGYSSLTHLKKFPIDKLKIDQSFIRDISVDKNDASIVATIIALAHNLNLLVIAEGVEKQEQFEFLQLQKCDGMQGYLFSPPLYAKQMESLLKTLTPHNDISFLSENT